MAQLNSLLFSVHGLADKQLELSVQTQLAAIYTRLQVRGYLALSMDISVSTYIYPACRRSWPW